MNLLLIKDENMTGEVLNETRLSFSSKVVSIKDIISQRVEQEVSEYNKKLPSIFNGLIQPSDTEKTLNGYKMKKKAIIDSEKQVLIALDAFKTNGFFILIDDYQAEQLDEIIQIKAETTVSFVKLTPLVGG